MTVNKKFFFCAEAALLLLLLFLPVVSATFEYSDHYWWIGHYDTRRSASIFNNYILANINDTSHFLTDCTITKTITGQPFILNYSGTQYVLLQTATEVILYDTACNDVQDLTIATSAPVTPYYYNGNWTVLIPQNNNSLHRYIVDPATGFTLNTSYVTTNLTGSSGLCTPVGGVDYCFYQNTTNDLVRLTLSTGTITTFAMMASTVDVSERMPSLAWINGRDMIVLTGLSASSTQSRVCVWDSTTEALYIGFNGGVCKTIHTGNLAYETVTPAMTWDVDGGSNPEISVGIAYKNNDGGTVRTDYANIYVYGVDGTIKYSKSRILGTVGAGAYQFALSNVWFERNGTGYFYACMIAFPWSVVGTPRLLCASPEGSLDVSLSGLVSFPWNSGGTPVNALFQVVRADWDARQAQYEVMGDGVYLNVDLRHGNNVTYKGFNNSGRYWAAGDYSGDAVLDAVFGTTTITLKRGDLANSAPQWNASVTNKLTTTASSPICVNTTYSVWTAQYYTWSDAEGQPARLFIDLYGDGRQNVTSGFGFPSPSPGESAILLANFSYNETGTFIAMLYLQDDYMASQGTLSASNLIEKAFTVSSDEDICNPPVPIPFDTPGGGSGEGTTPSQSLSSIASSYGLSGSWLTILWIVLMLGLTFMLVYKGVGNPYVLGFVNVFMLVLGNIFGVVSVWITVVVGLLIGAVAAITLFAGRGG